MHSSITVPAAVSVTIADPFHLPDSVVRYLAGIVRLLWQRHQPGHRDLELHLYDHLEGWRGRAVWGRHSRSQRRIDLAAGAILHRRGSHAWIPLLGCALAHEAMHAVQHRRGTLPERSDFESVAEYEGMDHEREARRESFALMSAFFEERPWGRSGELPLPREIRPYRDLLEPAVIRTMHEARDWAIAHLTEHRLQSQPTPRLHRYS